MAAPEGRIAVRGAGMHPYKWGLARFSVWLVSVGGFVVSEGLAIWLAPFPILEASIVLFIFFGTIWGCGALLTSYNPFFPEVAAAALWRWTRRARRLRS